MKKKGAQNGERERERARERERERESERESERVKSHLHLWQVLSFGLLLQLFGLGAGLVRDDADDIDEDGVQSFHDADGAQHAEDVAQDEVLRVLVLLHQHLLLTVQQVRRVP